MKNILINSFNHMGEEFWGQYIDLKQNNVVFYKNVSPDTLREVKNNFDLTIVDTYFNNTYFNRTNLVLLVNGFLSVTGLGSKIILSPIELEQYYIDLKVSRFNTDVVDILQATSIYNISA